MKKSDLRKNEYEHVIIKKSYEKLTTNFCKTYEKLTTTLQVSYENVKLAASDVIRETLCQSLADLQKTYENLTTNFGKILQSIENRAPGQIFLPFCHNSRV